MGSKVGKIPNNQTRLGQIWCPVCASSDVELPGLELSICRHCSHSFDPVLPKVWSPMPEQSKSSTSYNIAKQAMSKFGYEVTESNPSINPKELTVWDRSPFDENSKVIAVLTFDFVTGEWNGSDKKLVDVIRDVCK
ncbi:MAG TPA: hypothetical protein V6C57_06605 [Coleofasciculaceae cyanobacterium]